MSNDQWNQWQSSNPHENAPRDPDQTGERPDGQDPSASGWGAWGTESAQATSQMPMTSPHAGQQSASQYSSHEQDPDATFIAGAYAGDTRAASQSSAHQFPPTQQPSAQGDSAQGDSAQGDSAQQPSAQGDSAQGDSVQGDSVQGDSAQGDSAQAPSWHDTGWQPGMGTSASSAAQSEPSAPANWENSSWNLAGASNASQSSVSSASHDAAGSQGSASTASQSGQYGQPFGTDPYGSGQFGSSQPGAGRAEQQGAGQPGGDQLAGQYGGQFGGSQFGGSQVGGSQFGGSQFGGQDQFVAPQTGTHPALQPGMPGQGPWNPSAPAPAASTNPLSRFFKALFDFTFDKFATPYLIKVVFILVVVISVLQWLGWVIFGFAGSGIMASATGSSDNGSGGVVLGVLALLFGWIPALLQIAIFRVALEFMYASIRTSEDLHEMKRRGDL